MKKESSITGRRIGVVSTIFALIAFVFVFEYGRITQWNMFLTALLFLFIIVFTYGFVKFYIKTGLWKFTHRSVEVLDERELLLISQSLRYAYSIFTVAVLLLLLLVFILQVHISIVLVVSFIFLAHILPASVLAWSQKPQAYQEA
jgi:hypothetical protein